MIVPYPGSAVPAEACPLQSCQVSPKNCKIQPGVNRFSSCTRHWREAEKMAKPRPTTNHRRKWSSVGRLRRGIRLFGGRWSAGRCGQTSLRSRSPDNGDSPVYHSTWCLQFGGAATCATSKDPVAPRAFTLTKVYRLGSWPALDWI